MIPVRKTPIPTLPCSGAAEIAAWEASNRDNPDIPESVRIALRQHQAIHERLCAMGRNHRAVLVQLQLAFGIKASTERRASGRAVGAKSGGDGRKPRSERERLIVNRQRLANLTDWHDSLAKKNRDKMKRIDKRLENIPEPEGPDEQPAEEEAAVREQRRREREERYTLGGEADPRLQSVTETLMTGAEANIIDEVVQLEAPELPSEGCTLVDTRVDERVRYDFKLEVRRVVAEVEKKIFTDEQGLRRVSSASTLPLGPPRFGVTWGFLANMVILVVQYAMPMHRLANMLSSHSKRFTAGTLARMLRYVASHFLAIYLQLFDELADAEVLQGDDTSTRVLEVRRYFDEVDGQSHENMDAKEQLMPPWESYRTIANAEATYAKQRASQDDGAKEVSLAVRLSRELGFQSDRRTGRGGKRALNTTLLSGRANQSDPRTFIAFYRSHFGGVGNLLEVLLRRRSPRAKKLAVQTDLSTVNLIHDPKLLEIFDIAQYGCASHARRPFAQYEHDDPELCDMMLHFFKGVFIHEDGLDLYGRNPENVTAIRDVDVRENWESIKWLAEIMSKKWSAQTKLGEAARYIIRHYDALTAYLGDPRLEPTNNLSERLLRLEKLIQSSSMFRATLEGRFALDIMRSILQTAIAAEVPLYKYVLTILMTPRSDIEAHPERYTPRAWAQRNNC